MLKKLFKFVMWGFLGIVGLGIFAAIFGPKTPSSDGAAGAPTQSAPKEKRPAAEPVEEERVTVTAAALASAYTENSVAADLKYKGKKLRVPATISDISTNITGTPYLSLASSNMFQNPQAMFEKEHLSRIADAKKGEKVVLWCVGAGDVIKTAMLKKCEFAQ